MKNKSQTATDSQWKLASSFEVRVTEKQISSYKARAVELTQALREAGLPLFRLLFGQESITLKCDPEKLPQKNLVQHVRDIVNRVGVVNSSVTSAGKEYLPA